MLCGCHDDVRVTINRRYHDSPFLSTFVIYFFSTETTGPWKPTTESADGVSPSITIESSPSQAGTAVSTYENILHLLHETFETSVTGVRGTSQRPYRCEPHCNTRNDETKCDECENIENELNQIQSATSTNECLNDAKQNETKSKDCDLTTGIAQSVTTVKGPNKNIGQVINTEKCDVLSKLNLSPITTFSSRADGLACKGNTINTAIESKSFIIQQEDEHAAHFIPCTTKAGNSNAKGHNKFYAKNLNSTVDHRPCLNCCFCNPELHFQHDSNSPRACNYCETHRQTTSNDTSTNVRYEPATHINQLNNVATDRSSVAITERVNESRFRSNHKHTRTRCRATGFISTNCTKRSNRKTQQITQVTTDDVVNGNVPSANVKKQAENRIIQEADEMQRAHKKSSIPKLPPCEWLSNSCEINTNPSSTGSTTSTMGSSPRGQCRQDSKSIPNLNLSKSTNSPQKSRSNSRYQQFYSNEDDKDAVDSSESRKGNHQQGESCRFATDAVDCCNRT